jgi:glycine/D-amino acid oxidase-like deaminating enzyme/nitrite reductase/ring-hydroxylating ferredoxin subunit
MDTAVAKAPPLGRNERVDVVIIGSGIAGLSVAYETAARGLKVAVLDRGEIASGITARTTAHLSPICDDGCTEIIKLRGEEAARLSWQSQAAAIDRIEDIVNAHNIGCDFRRLDAFLFPAPEMPQSDLEEELRAAKKIGIDGEKIKGIPLSGYENTGVVRYRNQATFHPLRYLRALAEQIAARNGTLYANTVVTAVEETGDGVTVKTHSGHAVQAAAAVVATNAPINDRLALHSKMAPYRTYAMAITIPKDALPDALYWDTEDPYHYVRQQTGPGGVNHLIVGGRDHKSGEADDGEFRFKELDAWARALFPGLGETTHRWSGQVLETLDYSAFCGRNPGSRNVYVHTGDSGQGITHGAMAGLLIADLITTGKSPWAEAYEPGRTPLRAITNYARENMTFIKNLAEYAAPGEISSYDALKPGTGAIVRYGLSKIAAYRDASGKLHKCSAMCTHLGCHVHWNSLEGCWDCPCHGSQFAPDGTALNGPAVAPLEPQD